MQKCFDRAMTFLVEADMEATKKELKTRLLNQGVPLATIEESFKKADSVNSIDMVWEKRAKMQGKKVKGLESPAAAIQAAAKIKQEENSTTPEQAQQCLLWTNALLTGADVNERDYFRLCFIHEKSKKEFVTRNEIMAAGIEKAIQEKKPFFVAIGFGHCLDKNGVPQILKRLYDRDVKQVIPNPPSQVHLPKER